MILVIIVWLHASTLKVCPSRVCVLVFPLNLMHHICWHTQDAGCTNIAMMIGLQPGVLTQHCVFNDKGCLVGQCEVTLRVMRIHEVGPTSILKVLAFLPIHQLDVFGTIMSVMLHVSGTVMAYKCIAIIDVVDKGSGKAASFSSRTEWLTQALVSIVSIIGGRLVCDLGIIESKRIPYEIDSIEKDV